MRKISLLIMGFASALVIAILLLYMSSLIPDDMVQERFTESADILCEKEVFFCEQKNYSLSMIDRYADSILLNIAWNLKSNLPALMWTPYYSIELQNENDNLYDAVHGGKENSSQETMKEYVRYWHGSAGIVRILHLFLNIRGIYRLHGFLLALLTIVLITLLALKKMYAEAVSFIIGLIVINVWFVPLSLEYYWTFLCMLTTSILVIVLLAKRKKEWLSFLFFITGIITAYLDFFSTETITLTIPLLLAYRYEWKEGRRNDGFRHFVFISLNWGIGYVGMWISKWILASCIIGENVLPYISGHINERIGRDFSGLSFFSLLFGSIRNNLSCLFPWGYGAPGIVGGITTLIIALYIGFVYRQDKKYVENKGIYLAIAAIPYVRYFVLYNHSFLHYFFTYRAQIATIMIVCLVLFETIDWKTVKKRKKKRGPEKKRGKISANDYLI
ncbi:MAG: hypothetical protein K5739_09605 [Lachnospiraceae bacterium]|nr:hypothetical protein [Lachnospiraceae bacterium]